MNASLLPLAALLAATACSTSGSASPTCTNESTARPFRDAGVLPPRSLPTGFPCAAGAVCYAAIDDCPGDWPDAAATPSSTSSTAFVCACDQAAWTCAPENAGPPTCPVSAVTIDSGTD